VKNDLKPFNDSDDRESVSRYLVMVCTYNERENLPSLVHDIGKSIEQADILIIDDNSPDGTGEWVRKEKETNPKLYLIERNAKLGLGSAIRTGLKYAIEQKYTCVVNMDADYSHDPICIPTLISAVRDYPVCLDVAIGSRYVPGGKISGLSFFRRTVSRAINGYARQLLGLRIGDWSSSFRAYNTDVLAKIDWASLNCNGYGSLQEILWHAHLCGARIGEFPIHYVNRRRGKSKISWRDAYGALQTIHRLAIMRLFRNSTFTTK
jgi:dolichol-phosphate mannosyltransferase